VTPGIKAAVIGGGFIGSEMAAALALNQASVTMIFPDQYLVHRVFPDDLARALHGTFERHGITLLTRERPASIRTQGNRFIIVTESGKAIESDIVLAGVGINPSLELARNAGLQTANGIIVNEYLETSHSDIYAAGDNAFFPYQALGKQIRVEHWDNALNQGKCAGRNMAGAREAYMHMPYFFSDLFEFGYEAVGEVDSRLETVADWEKEYDTGVIYYLRDNKVRGVMMCNVWERVEAARQLILKGEVMTRERLRGALQREPVRAAA
jgi:NADPH-dependent 2,4-dienoyl-CoA reductase/sulfur reductase-like enzyme